jgi:hypothetical protein
MERIAVRPDDVSDTSFSTNKLDIMVHTCNSGYVGGCR